MDFYKSKYHTNQLNQIKIELGYLKVPVQHIIFQIKLNSECLRTYLSTRFYLHQNPSSKNVGA